MTGNQQIVEWLKARCPICGREYPYVEAYKPKVCGSYDCVKKFLHPELKGETKH